MSMASKPRMNGYLLQAIAIPLWWAAMQLSPTVYACFAYSGISRSALFAFALPDLILISGLSWLAWRRPHPVLCGCIFGAFAYGALWCMASSCVTGGGYLSSIVMLLGSLFNVLLLLGQNVFRMSTSSGTARNVCTTLLQSAILWVTLLILFPLGIVHSSGDWPPFFPRPNLALGSVLFLCASALGIWSGIVMSVRGSGTPLPLDAPQRLVLSGPYAYVRNPMAIAGLAQGFGVAIALSSIEVTAYVSSRACSFGTPLCDPKKNAICRASLVNPFPSIGPP